MEVGLRYFYHNVRKHRATRHSACVPLSSATQTRHRSLGPRRQPQSHLQEHLLVRLLGKYHHEQIRTGRK